MRHKVISWLVNRFPLSWEREFPLRKPKRVTLWYRAKKMLEGLAGCLIGLVLVAFGISAIDGQWDQFFPIAGILVAAGLVTAALTVLAIFLLNGIRNLRRSIKARAFRVEARDSIRLDCTPEKAAERCLAALRQLPQGADFRPDVSKPGEILAKTRISMKSAGEVITFSLVDLGDGATQVNIRSCPWWDTTMVDWGINAENVAILTRYLMQAAPHGEASG